MKSIRTLPEEIAQRYRVKPALVEDPQRATISAPIESLLQLAEYVREYRKYQKAYFAKIKRKEFAKDEQHFMMKYQEKIDLLLKTINV